MWRKRFAVLAAFALLSLVVALPAMAATTTTFDAEGAVGSLLGTVIGAGWPIFLALIVGMLAVTLASNAGRTAVHKLTSLFSKKV